MLLSPLSTATRTQRRHQAIAVAWALIFSLTTAASAMGQGRASVGADEPRLQGIEDRVSQPYRLAPYLSPPSWIPGVEAFVYWQTIAPGDGHWVYVDAVTGEKRVIVTPADLQARIKDLLGPDSALPFAPPFIVSDGPDAILFSVAGAALSLSIGTGEVTRIADPFVALRLRPGAQVSPSGNNIAIEEESAVVVYDRAGVAIARTPADEGAAWKLPAEAWSPRGALVVWKVDSRRVHRLPIIDYEGALEQVSEVTYSKVGTPLPTSELFVLQPSMGGSVRSVWSQSSEGYAFLTGWRTRTGEALVTHLARDGKTLSLQRVDVATGDAQGLVSETNPQTFVGDLRMVIEDHARQVTPLSDDSGFLWMSQRDGWRHLYRYDYDGRLLGQVTRGAFPVHEVSAISADGRNAYILASAEPGAPYEWRPYRVPIGGGDLEPLSPAAGFHRLSFSPSRLSFSDAYSTPSLPPVRDVVSLPGGSRRYHDQDAETLGDYVPPEAFTAMAADGVTELHGAVFKPRNFDPTLKYPVVNWIYGGPFTSIVPQTFFGSSETMGASGLAEAGFIVVMVDGRGTYGRSKAFQDAHYGRIGQAEILDQIAAIRAAAADRPYMDLSRVGAVGYSWGGYFALRAILTGGDFYEAAYAGAPGELEEDAVVNEPNMGLIDQNPGGYRAGSNIESASMLQGALKLMHGDHDRDASIATTMRMSQALVLADKPFEMLIVPGMGHNFEEHAPYLRRDLALFMIRHLGGPER